MDKEYKHEFKKQAEKYIEKLDKPTQKRIIEGIEKLPLQGDIKLLHGYKEKLYRLRIGGYRIIFNMTETLKDKKLIVLVIVQTVDTRGDSY